MERKEVPGKAYLGERRADGRQPLGLPLGVADGIRIPIEASSTGSTIKPRSVVPWSYPAMLLQRENPQKNTSIVPSDSWTEMVNYLHLFFYISPTQSKKKQL